MTRAVDAGVGPVVGNEFARYQSIRYRGELAAVCVWRTCAPGGVVTWTRWNWRRSSGFPTTSSLACSIPRTSGGAMNLTIPEKQDRSRETSRDRRSKTKCWKYCRDNLHDSWSQRRRPASDRRPAHHADRQGQKYLLIRNNWARCRGTRTNHDFHFSIGHNNLTENKK